MFMRLKSEEHSKKVPYFQPMVWVFLVDDQSDLLFDINPFTLPKSDGLLLLVQSFVFCFIWQSTIKMTDYSFFVLIKGCFQLHRYG